MVGEKDFLTYNKSIIISILNKITDYLWSIYQKPIENRYDAKVISLTYFYLEIIKFVILLAIYFSKNSIVAGQMIALM